MNLVVLSHIAPFTNGPIYLITSYNFCKHTIVLHNKPTTYNEHCMWFHE